MKAAVFKQPGEPMVVETVADPAPEAGDLVLKVAYCGICGTDLHSTRAGPAALPCNSILGHEFVGEVVATGSAVRADWRDGERVCSLPFRSCGHCAPCRAGRPFECARLRCVGLDVPGAFADYVLTGAAEAVRLPDALDFERAALIEPLAVGLHAVRIAGLRAGQRVLVIGAGPIGLAVALWARTLGARDVVVSEMSPQRSALAHTLGATAVIDPGADLAGQFAAASGGAPEIIFECVGAPGLLQACFNAAPRRARVIGVGVCESPDTILPFPAMVKELELRFAIAYTRDDFETVIAMLAQGRIDARALVTRVVTLAELPAAFEALRTPSDQCKVLARL